MKGNPETEASKGMIFRVLGMASEEMQKQASCEIPSPQLQPKQQQYEEETKTQPPHHPIERNSTRRISHFKEYKFFRSFSAKVENWPVRKAEALWRRMREKKIAGTRI